ncbi:hypothetical protein EDB92DRAFT_2103639 [Lactarius akahatsu]|uniref:Uncharacterized protein n=1 Tax=Lactarius akahatsu TaxID=416441 RepID=A0AAD4QDG3_9AGAM|nr:hypothetical protein EDB92DRAFT_2103639 [Lactarius akahatsu]
MPIQLLFAIFRMPFALCCACPSMGLRPVALQPFASDVPPSALFPPYSMLFGDLPFGTCNASNYSLKAKVCSALTADSHTQLPLRVPRSGVTRARGMATPTTYFSFPRRRQTFPWLALPQALPGKRATDDQQVAYQQRADFPDLAQAAAAYSSRGVTQLQAAPTPRESKAPTSARTSKSTHGNAGAIVVTSISCITIGGEGGYPVASLRTLTARCSDDKSKQLAPEVALSQGSAPFLSRRILLGVAISPPHSRSRGTLCFCPLAVSISVESANLVVLSLLPIGLDNSFDNAMRRSLPSRCHTEPKTESKTVTLKDGAQEEEIGSEPERSLGVQRYGNRATKVFVLDYPPGIRNVGK